MSERYTIQGGLEHHLFNRFGDNSKFLLPLLLLLVGIVLLGVQHFNPSHKAINPVQLGIYTVKTPGGQNASDSSSSSSSNSPSSSSPSLLGSAAGSSSSQAGFGSYSLQGTSTPVTGGMGGGLNSTTTSGSGSTTSDSGSNNLSVTLQTPGTTVGPVSVDSTTTTIDPGIPKP